MRTIQVTNGYYRTIIGNKSYKIYASDLKMISKRRKSQKPPLPIFVDFDLESPSSLNIPIPVSEKVAI